MIKELAEVKSFLFKRKDPYSPRDLWWRRQAGGAGLTLVTANHVFLLEPTLDAGIAQQAVARVHRIGQQRPVHITRFVLRDSIEESIQRLQARPAHLPTGAELSTCRVGAFNMCRGCTSIAPGLLYSFPVRVLPLACLM